MDFTWPNILTGLVRGEDLDSSTTEWAMGEILAGNASPVQMAGFMVALRAKGETITDKDAGVNAASKVPAEFIDARADE